MEPHWQLEAVLQQKSSAGRQQGAKQDFHQERSKEGP